VGRRFACPTLRLSYVSTVAAPTHPGYRSPLGNATTGPLKFQGNHGVGAFRNIKITVPAEK